MHTYKHVYKPKKKKREKRKRKRKKNNMHADVSARVNRPALALSFTLQTQKSPAWKMK